MLKTISKTNLKRINWLLKKHFYSVEEINFLNFKKAYKIVKLISKIEGLKLSRRELKELTMALRGEIKLNSAYKVVVTLFEFLSETFSIDKVSEKITSLILSITFIFNFRRDRLEVLRN